MDISQIKIGDYNNNTITNTILNQLQTADTSRLSGGVFNYNTQGSVPDSNWWTTTTSSGGTATITNSELKLNVTTTSNSSAELSSVSIARYVGSCSNFYRAVNRMDSGTTNNVRRWGASNANTSPTDGFFFELSGSTFCIVSRLASSDTVINSGSFNGNGSISGGTYSLDTNYHRFEIFYSQKTVIFSIDNKPIHTLSATSTPLAGTRHLKPYISNINTGVGSSVSIYSMVSSISRLGSVFSQPKGYFQQGTTTGVLLKIGPGSLHSLHPSGIVNNSVITLYDGITSGGTILYSTGTMTVNNQSNNLPFDVKIDGTGGANFNTGLYLTITVANSNCLIMYE